MAAGLVGLAEHSLLGAVTGPDGTRYRALETIRQYGAERLGEADELTEAHARHLRWCLAEAGALEASLAPGRPAGRAAFDQVADELRAALDWAAAEPASGPTGTGSRYSSRSSASPAACPARHSDGTSRRPRSPPATPRRPPRCTSPPRRPRTGTSAARRCGCIVPARTPPCGPATGPRAAYQLAQMAELVNRAPGLMPERTSLDAAALIAEAAALADGDPAAEARVVVAEGFSHRELDPESAETGRARHRARPAGGRPAGRERRAGPADQRPASPR